MSKMIKESARRSSGIKPAASKPVKKYSRTKYVIVNDNDNILFDKKTFSTPAAAMKYGREHFRGGIGRDFYVVTLKQAQRNEPGLWLDDDDYDEYGEEDED
jgi:hypothetical protein